MLLPALVLDTIHTLDSNYLLDQLQCSIKAVKFWCGDNYILNNVTLQLFLPIPQVFPLKLDICNVQLPEIERDPPSITFNPKPEVTHFFFTDLEKEEYVNLFSGTSLNTIII